MTYKDLSKKIIQKLGLRKLLLDNPPGLIHKIYYYECISKINTRERKLYFTFDDGPSPVATLFILDQLKKYNAKATFFCIGKNVEAHRDIYKKIIEEGHAVGNHTYNHLNASEIESQVYLDNITKAQNIITSDLFRPPFGQITNSLARQLKSKPYCLKPVMWSVSSEDFNIKIPAEECYNNVIRKAKKGSIILFHDTEQALIKLKIVLPMLLEYFSSKGYLFESIPTKKVLNRSVLNKNVLNAAGILNTFLLMIDLLDLAVI